MLICVPEIAIIMLKYVLLKIAQICLKCANSTDKKNGLPIVNVLERSPVYAHFLRKYESFLRLSVNC